MKKIIFLFLLTLFLSGCATYKFQRGNAPYGQGFVVSRDDRVIPEYTIGKDNSAPNLKLAKERLKRRRDKVEYYYKRMGLIESRLKETFWDPPTLFLKFVGGIFRLPAIAISDYKYEHNPKYRERVKQLEEEKDKREEARIKKLKDELNVYIQKDSVSEKEVVAEKKTGEIQLAKQVSGESVTQVTAQEEAIQQPAVAELTQKSAEQPKVSTEESVKPQELQPPQAELTLKKEEQPTPPIKEAVKPQELPQQAIALPKEEQPITKTEETVKTAPIQKQKVARQKTKPTKVTPKGKIKPKKVESMKLPGQPVAVIIAKPTKGLSPLKVHFYGSKSYVSKGRIIAYTWDFGDGDTSTKVNPVNTYYSGTFTPKNFTITLTVQDDKGNTVGATTTIEVLNK